MTYETPAKETVQTYKGYVVNMDDKQEVMSKTNTSSVSNPRQKFLGDFKNVFENMFLYVKEPGDTVSQ